MKCPHCGSKNVHKYGKMHNRKYIQRYYCKNCEMT
ncbi:IS1/IS1595 family N-terminal zinc-binding domain-containing protein [Palaeococcus sp. (in: euryarchaeotes)]